MNVPPPCKDYFYYAYDWPYNGSKTSPSSGTFALVVSNGESRLPLKCTCKYDLNFLISRHVHLGLEQTVFRNADIHVLHLLGHNLCVSNIAYARWLSHLLSNLPAFLDDHLEERRTVGQLIHAIRPSLTSEFLSPNGLPCNGLPFDKDWTTAISCIEECAERKQNLMDCITYGLYIPLYISPTQPSYSDSKLATEPTPNISLDIDWSTTVRDISTESSRPRIFVGVTSPDIGRLPMYGDSSESDQKGKMCLSSSSTCVHACTLPLSHSGPTEYPSFSISSILSTLYHAVKLLRGFLKSWYFDLLIYQRG